MSDDWSTPTAEYERPGSKATAADDAEAITRDEIDPVLGITERDLNLVDAFYYHLALEASQDPRPNTAEEDADDEWLIARARERMSMSPAEVRAQRARGRR